MALAAAREPAPRGRPPRSDRPDGRERLVAAALVEFGQRGYAATTVDQLVRAAGVNPPTLYHHFGGKAGLFVAAARDAYDQMITAFRSSMPEDGYDFDQAVNAVLVASVQLMHADQALAKMVLVIQFELPRQPDLAEQLRPILRDFRGFFDGVAALAPPILAASDEDRRDLSRALVSIIAGLSAQALLLPDPSDFPRLVAAMRALLRQAPSRDPEAPEP